MTILDLNRWMRESWEATQEMLCPPECVWCEVPVAEGNHFCGDCLSHFRSDYYRCQRCASPLPPVVPNTSCVRCETAGWRFSEVVTLGPYRGRLREAVILMKKRPFELLRRSFGELLASELETRVQDSNPVLLSMPNHWSRTYLRRICHASSLTRALSTKLEWPIVRGAVVRTRKTAKQGMLSWSERAVNVRGAFRVRQAKRIEGRCIVLVDDVLTSGATANEVSKVLMRAGAAKVVVAVVARGTGAREVVLKAATDRAVGPMTPASMHDGCPEESAQPS